MARDHSAWGDLSQIPTDVYEHRRSPVSEAWYEKLARYLRGRAPRMIGDRLRRQIDPTDLVDVVVIKVMKEVGGFERRGTGKTRGWIGCWLYRVARDMGRGAGRIREEVADGLSQLPGDAEAPDDEAMRNEDIARGGALLDTLSPDERNIVDMRLGGNLTYKEISENLDKPLGTVQACYRRALGRLKQKELGGSKSHDKN